MADLLHKFSQALKQMLRKSTRCPRELQLEDDIRKLLLYTSANGDTIIDSGTTSPASEQAFRVHQNVHERVRTFCDHMDVLLRADGDSRETVSRDLKARIGFTLELKKSSIQHEESGTGLFVDGRAPVGSVVAFYPGVVYSPSNHPRIPGYPFVSAGNTSLIARYDGVIINAKPWGTGGRHRTVWDWSSFPLGPDGIDDRQGFSDRVWRFLGRPETAPQTGGGVVLELRNPLALGHFANHPARGMSPNVMVCPYDFPLEESAMRPYIPNVEPDAPTVEMKRVGSFWFRPWRFASTGSRDDGLLKTVVLVATRQVCDEEVLLNYRLSCSKGRRPSWYFPLDSNEEERRWS